MGRNRRSSGIPRSTASSREHSPTRSSNYGQFNKSRTPQPQTKRPLMTENILKQSREAESALADALVIASFQTLGLIWFGLGLELG